jgi:hypothetical protein
VNAKMTKLFSYVVARDFGFAPNPFYQYCTLATCKPRIRNAANVGDWVIGNGPKPKQLDDQLIFAMQVTEKISYDQYWEDDRFKEKQPFLGGSLKQTYGDNIYHKEGDNWLQANSHHSYPDGSINDYNLKRDTKSDKVLISSNFYYFGEKSLTIPGRFKDKICRNMINHLLVEDERTIQKFLTWLDNSSEPGLKGNPRQFKTFERYNGL